MTWKNLASPVSSSSCSPRGVRLLHSNSQVPYLKIAQTKQSSPLGRTHPVCPTVKDEVSSPVQAPLGAEGFFLWREHMVGYGISSSLRQIVNPITLSTYVLDCMYLIWLLLLFLMASIPSNTKPHLPSKEHCKLDFFITL